MNKYKNNIKLDYIHTILRNFNVIHGIWLIYLVAKGFSLLQIGIFEGIFHISTLMFEVPTGIIADLFGRKLSRVLGILSYILYILILVFSNNFVIIGIGFILCGLSYSLESGSGEAIIYDSLILTGDQEKFMKFMGKKEVLFQLSGGIALLIGGYIAIQSYNLSFTITLMTFIAALIPILLMKETLIKKPQNKVKISQMMYEHYIKSTKVVIKNKKLVFLIIIGAMMAAPVTSLFFYFQIHLSELNYSISTIGIFLGVHSFFGALGGYFAEEIEKKYKEKLILYIIPIFIIFSFWLIQFDQLVFVPFVLLGFSDSIFYVVLGDYINRIIPSEQRATVLSFNSLIFSIIMILIFPVLGLIGDIYSLKFAFMLLACLVSVFYLFLLYVLKSLDFFDKNV